MPAALETPEGADRFSPMGVDEGDHRDLKVVEQAVEDGPGVGVEASFEHEALAFVEIDPAELGRASKAGLLAAFGGFVTPFVCCYLFVVWLGGSQMEAVFVGIAAGVTSLATKSRILVDLKLLDTRVAHVLMAGALIADTASLVIFAGILGVAELGGVRPAELVMVAGKAVLFFVVAVFFGMKVFPLLGRRIQGLKAFGRTAAFTLVLLVAFAFAEGAERNKALGIWGSTGAIGGNKSHEFQVLASAGYTVVYSNPRGSKGYGRDHCAAIRGRWGDAKEALHVPCGVVEEVSR